MTKTILTRSIIEDVKQTDRFKSLSTISKRLFLKRNNLVKIEHALTVINNIGYDEWNRISSFSCRNQEVIEELIKKP